MRYVPPSLLKDKSIGDMGFDEFIDYLAKARYAQEVEKEIMMRAISECLSEQ